MRFFFNSTVLGVGLAMDAFSVALANGLSEPGMGRGRMCAMAGVFTLFQALMPMIGWGCVHTVLGYVQILERAIPFIALMLLLMIGGSMLWEGISGETAETPGGAVGAAVLLMQGLATSIDALSVGFTVGEYGVGMAMACAGIIAAVTFAICMMGIVIGKKFGTRLAGRATIFGGLLLMAIGLEIFCTRVL